MKEIVCVRERERERERERGKYTVDILKLNEEVGFIKFGRD